MHVCVCLCFRERERERETSDEGEGDPATTFGTRARNLGFSTFLFHIAGQQVLIPSEMEVFCFLLYAIQSYYLSDSCGGIFNLVRENIIIRENY